MVATPHQSSTEEAIASFSFFRSLTATKPDHRLLPIEDLALVLTNHHERDEQDGPGFSPTLYQDGATRGNDGVVALTALVLDYDSHEPDWARLERYWYVAYTTWSHTPEDPHWRVIIFLAEPVPKHQWEATVWANAAHTLAPDADPSCKDASRFYWLPSCQMGAVCQAFEHAGELLDWHTLPKAPEPERVERQAQTTPAGNRPGDHFNRRAQWPDILPDWLLVRSDKRNTTEYWRCPGSDKRHGHCATIGADGYDNLYTFCNAEGTPFETRQSYTKFRAYSLLNHGGDDRAAAKALGDQGYGTPATASAPSPLRLASATHSVSPSAITSNGDGDHGGNDEHGGSPDPAPAARDALSRTDLGNAQLFADHYRGDIRYCHPWSSWLAWDGRRYQVDQRGQVAAWGKSLVRLLYAEATKAVAAAEEAAAGVSVTDPSYAAVVKATEAAIAELKWALQSAKAERLAAMLKLTQSEPDVPVTHDELNAAGWVLTVRNGDLDLRTARLQPHGRSHLSTKLAPVAYDPAAQAPLWDAFLARILPDPDVRAFLQRACGYACTGVIREHALFFLWGLGANGKSTLLNALRRVLGEYALQAAPELLLVDKHGDRHPTERADLFGARLVATVEIDDGRRFAESLLKQMTGGDPMTARRMRQDYFSWMPTHKLFLAANHQPQIRGTDHGIWRRIHLVPFTVQIPAGEQDPELGDKLAAEASGILRWLVEGCLAWQRDGLGLPEAVRAATDAYRAEQDVLGGFLTERCVLEPHATVTAAALYAAYTAWAEGAGERPISKTALGKRLGERGLQAHYAGRSNTRTWTGIGLRADGEAP